MKKVRVIYRDDPAYSGGRHFEYETRPYLPADARDVADNLSAMGCTIVRFVPVSEAA